MSRAYLLWPALQAILSWLTGVWIPVRGAEVKVRWQGFSLKQRAWFNITNQRRAYEEQPLLLYLAKQQLLGYACQRHLLLLADAVLRGTTVELTQAELTWLVTALVASKNMFEAERLLASYVLTRRNALSSTAAVEYALVKAATASFIPN
ncbi:hypothetical protein OEZ86_003267 [Tetradesmus obliquus]|nr:hypothetical protein OEZ86_003267 [Tetradesmus obliquus]